jgi:photosystem II stability/assembly factor-like uncharacterized protein
MMGAWEGPVTFGHHLTAAQPPAGSRCAQPDPGRRIALALGVAIVVALAGAGCSGAKPNPSRPVAQDPGLVHIHGLGINPRDGLLYAATHTGLFVVRDGGASRVTDRYQDTMGFTVIGPDHFIASGHPDFRDPKLLKAGRPPLLGLVESRDAGRSWEPASLLGEVDFHVLEVAHGKVYGFDATGGRFMVSWNRRRWQTRSSASLLDFAVSPRDDKVILAATGHGLLRSADGGRHWRPAGGPAVALLEWDRPEGLWAVAGDGRLWRSVDAGRTWERRGQLGGPPDALLAQAGTLYAAVHERGILSSTDEGATWHVLYSPSGPTTG